MKTGQLLLSNSLRRVKDPRMLLGRNSLSKQHSDISNQEWTLAIMKLIVAAYRFRSSGKVIGPTKASNFLRIAEAPPKVCDRCMGYVAELSSDFSRWKLLKKFGNWDEKSWSIFKKHIRKRTLEDGFLNVKEGRLVPKLIRAP